MAKELPKNIEALQSIGFEEIKKTANNLKRIKMLVDKTIEKNELKLLEEVKKQIDTALNHLEQYTEALNLERETTEEIKGQAKEIIKRT